MTARQIMVYRIASMRRDCMLARVRLVRYRLTVWEAIQLANETTLWPYSPVERYEAMCRGEVTIFGTPIEVKS